MAGYIHHSVGQGGTGENAGGRDRDDRFETCGFRTDGRVDEIDGVVAHTNDEIEYGKYA